MSFINYTGKVEPKGKKYLFRINGEPNITSYYFVNIANPTIDNAFKKVFYTENEITRSFAFFPKNCAYLSWNSISSFSLS